VSAPLTTTRSFIDEPGGWLGVFSAKTLVDPDISVRLPPIVNVPFVEGETSPGANVPPLWTVTLPSNVPTPANAPVLLTASVAVFAFHVAERAVDLQCAAVDVGRAGEAQRSGVGAGQDCGPGSALIYRTVSGNDPGVVIGARAIERQYARRRARRRRPPRRRRLGQGRSPG
jgi:hypothetical protein